MSPPRKPAPRRLKGAQAGAAAIAGASFLALAFALWGGWFAGVGASSAGDKALSFAAWVQLGDQESSVARFAPDPSRGETCGQETGRYRDRTARLQQHALDTTAIGDGRRPGGAPPLDRTYKRPPGKSPVLPSSRELRLTFDATAFAYEVSERRPAGKLVESLRPRLETFAPSAPRGPPAT